MSDDDITIEIILDDGDDTYDTCELDITQILMPDADTAEIAIKQGELDGHSHRASSNINPA